MNKVSVIALILTVLLCCPSYPSERVKIGFMLKTMQEERYQRDKAAFLSKVKELGASPVFESCYNHEMVQVSRFENMLAHGVKVIVLQPVNTETAAILVNMAHEKGVRVVGYDSLPMNCPLDVMVMQDSWAVGKLQGQALLNWFKARQTGKLEGRVALIMGQPGDSNALFMSDGATEIINSHRGLHLVTQEAHQGWDPVRAQETTNKVLDKFGNRVDAFICNNDRLATGVIAALKERGLDRADRVFVAGADADLVNIRYLVEERQSIDVWKLIDPLAEKAAEVAVKLALNPEKKISELIKPDKMVNNGLMEVPTIVTPVRLVTRDNIDATLIASGVFTRRQIYGGEPIP